MPKGETCFAGTKWTVRSGCCRHWADFLCSAGNAAVLSLLSSCPGCCCFRMIGAVSLHTPPHQPRCVSRPSPSFLRQILMSQDYCNLLRDSARMPTLNNKLYFKSVPHLARLEHLHLLYKRGKKVVYSGVSWHHLTRSGVAVQVCSLYKWSFVAVAVCELTLCFSSPSQRVSHSYAL